MSKILIIEDEELVARMYQKVLTLEGFEVEVAIGGEEGIEKATKIKPNLILLDIMMPGMDGIEVLDHIKHNDSTKNIPVVLLTNLSGSYDEKYGISKGAAGYWVKADVDIKQLGNKINKLLDEKGK